MIPQVEPSSYQLAAALIRHQLSDGACRQVWEPLRQEGRGLGADFSIRAIARAMGAYQKQTYGLDVQPQQYKDRVARALAGEYISSETVYLLAETFRWSKPVVESIIQALTLGNDSTETVEFLRAHPQVMILNAFLNVEIDQQNPRLFTLNATYTLMSLDKGCSALIIQVPQSHSLVQGPAGFEMTRLGQEQGEWLLTPSSPIDQLQTFLLRLSLEGEADQLGPELYRISFPGSSRSYSVGLRLESGGHLLEVTYRPLYPQGLKGQAGKEPTGQEQRELTKTFSTIFYPKPEMSSLELTWELKQNPDQSPLL